MLSLKEALSTAVTVTGTVLWFNPERGIGFIRLPGDPPSCGSVFLHAKHILDSDFPRAGDEVMFTVGADWRSRGQKIALEVRRVAVQ